MLTFSETISMKTKPSLPSSTIVGKNNHHLVFYFTISFPYGIAHQPQISSLERPPHTFQYWECILLILCRYTGEPAASHYCRLHLSGHDRNIFTPLLSRKNQKVHQCKMLKLSCRQWLQVLDLQWRMSFNIEGVARDNVVVDEERRASFSLPC